MACFGSLAEELIDKVAVVLRQSWDTQSLNSLSKVSKQLHRIVGPHLYQRVNVVLLSHPYRRITGSGYFLAQTLLDNPSLCYQIKSLTVSRHYEGFGEDTKWHEQFEEDYSGMEDCEDESEVPSPLDDINRSDDDADTILCLLLELCDSRSLKSLDLSKYCWSIYTNPLKNIYYSGVLSSLQVLDFQVDQRNLDTASLPAQALFTSKTIHALALRDTSCYNPSMVYPHSSLRHLYLEIDDYGSGSYQLASFCPNFQSITLATRPHDFKYDRVGDVAQQVLSFRGLLESSETLARFEIRIRSSSEPYDTIFRISVKDPGKQRGAHTSEYHFTLDGWLDPVRLSIEDTRPFPGTNLNLAVAMKHIQNGLMELHHPHINRMRLIRGFNIATGAVRNSSRPVRLEVFQGAEFQESELEVFNMRLDEILPPLQHEYKQDLVEEYHKKKKALNEKPITLLDDRYPRWLVGWLV